MDDFFGFCGAGRGGHLGMLQVCFVFCRETWRVYFCIGVFFLERTDNGGIYLFLSI